MINYTDQRLSWEVNSYSASEQSPCLIRKSKVHYSVHSNLPQVPILGQMHPVHNFAPYFPKIHSNIYLSAFEILFPSYFRPKLSPMITARNIYTVGTQKHLLSSEALHYSTQCVTYVGHSCWTVVLL